MRTNTQCLQMWTYIWFVVLKINSELQQQNLHIKEASKSLTHFSHRFCHEVLVTTQKNDLSVSFME